MTMAESACSSSMVISYAHITDTDLVRRACDFNVYALTHSGHPKWYGGQSVRTRGRSVGSDSARSEISDDAHLSEEMKKMQEMGLPTAFATSKKYYFDKKSEDYFLSADSEESADETQDETKAIDEEFLHFWRAHGNDIVTRTFRKKYGSPDDSNDKDDDGVLTAAQCGVRTGGGQQVWNCLWVRHYQEQYEKNYHQFVAEVATRVEEKLAKLSLSIGKTHSDDQNQMKAGPSQSNSVSENGDEKITTESGNSSKPSSSHSHNGTNDGNSDDEPPDERPVKVKRECEDDRYDADEDLVVNEDNSGGDADWVDVKASSKKKKKKNKKARQTLVADNTLDKYWSQRYRLFSRFDEGIKLDDESWYSVTPERIAEHIAKRCIKTTPANSATTLIIDAFCGAGGNVIQFALASPTVRVIAIDIDPSKLELAQNNAKVYGVEQNIEFICADFMHIAKTGLLKADVVFLSPPWGGPTYLNQEQYSLDMMTPNGKEIVKIVQDNITKDIAFLLPRNVNSNELVALAGEGNSVEIENNLLNKKVKTVTAYYGSLLKL